MSSYISDQDFLPSLVSKIMNSLVLRCVLHVMFEHYAFTGWRGKDSHLTQFGTVVYGRALASRRPRKKRVGKFSAFPVCAPIVGQPYRLGNPCEVSFTTGQFTDLFGRIPAEFYVPQMILRSSLREMRRPRCR